MRERIAVGMSGGVDSSVAAMLLRDAGYDVAGITLSLTPGSCEADAADARRVAELLGIEHHVIDLRNVFRDAVIRPFCDAYLCGHTPNPCVLCNCAIKFGAMLHAAQSFGASRIATGHYAKTENRSGRTLLLRADSRKDQSYFLCRLTQAQLSAAMFPLAGMEKEDLRKLAENAGLPVAHKKDSQDVCFIPDNDYAAFLLRETGEKAKPGDFIDTSGNVIGQHQGIVHYTVGQRKGLGAFGKPMFVTSIDAVRNRVVLGVEGQQYACALIADELNWIAFDAPPETFRCEARIRFRAAPAPATVHSFGKTAQVVFDEPQRSVTPGQTVAFYDGDVVLGGGTIRSAEGETA